MADKEPVARAPARRPSRRVAFLLPNLFTTLALLAGFYSIIKSVQLELVVAGWAIVLAAILDMIDGRLARLIDAESEFGAQYDSLSDVICFGAAPAVLAIQWGLTDFGRFGFAAGFFYCAAAAVRLARFNVMRSAEHSSFFSGLPSPMAGITAAMGTLMLGADPGMAGNLFVLLLLIVLGITMVSDVRFYSFKDIDLRARLSNPSLLVLLLFAVSMAAGIVLEFREAGLFFFAMLYLLSGYALKGKELLLRLDKLKSEACGLYKRISRTIATWRGKSD